MLCVLWKEKWSAQLQTSVFMWRPGVHTHLSQSRIHQIRIRHVIFWDKHNFSHTSKTIKCILLKSGDAKAQVHSKEGQCQCSLPAQSWNCSATFWKEMKKWFALSATNDLKQSTAGSHHRVKSMISLNLRKGKKGGNPLTCAQSLRREVSQQLEHPRKLVSSLLPYSRKMSLPVSVAVCQGSVTPFLFLDPPSFQGVFSPLLPSLLRSELMQSSFLWVAASPAWEGWLDRGLGRAPALQREGSAGRGGDQRRSGSQQPWDHPLLQESSETE